MELADAPIGTRVIVRDYPNAGARTIVKILNQFFYPGGVSLDRPVVGVYIWNVEDLERAPIPPAD